MLAGSGSGRNGGTRENISSQDRHPRAGGPDWIDEDHSANSRLVGCSPQHGDAAPPRVAKDVPAANAERSAKGTDVGSVVVDGGRRRVGGLGRFAAAALRSSQTAGSGRP